MVNNFIDIGIYISFLLVGFLLYIGDILDFEIYNHHWKEKYYQIIEEYELRSADKVRFKNKIYNKEFRRALNKDLTKEFESDINFASSPKQNFIYCVIGKTGRGKSTLAYIIYNKIKKLKDSAKCFFIYNLSEALKILREIKDIAYSVIVLDEDLDLTGQGSITIKKHLSNVIKMCREFSVCFIFNIKTFTDLGNIDIYLQLFGIKLEKKMTRCIWLTDEGIPNGLVHFKKDFDDQEYEKIHIQKVDKWEDLLEKEGQSKAWNLENIKDVIFNKIKDINALEDYNNTSNLQDFIIDNYSYSLEIVEGLARRVKAKIGEYLKANKKQEKQYINNPLEISVKDFKLIDIQKLEDKYFLKVIDLVEITEKQKQLLRLKFVEKLGSKQLIAKLKTKEFNQNFQISNFTKLIAPELGLKMELGFYDYLSDKGKRFEYFGGRINPLDFINHSDKQVISLKSVYRETDVLNHIYTLNLDEYEKSRSLKYELVYSVIIWELKEVHTYLCIRSEK